MSGQGSPKFVFAIGVARRIAEPWWIIALLLIVGLPPGSIDAQDTYRFQAPSTTQSANADLSTPSDGMIRADAVTDISERGIPMRLRFSWGGGSPLTWRGQIRVLGGKFSDALPLGLDADANASVHLDEGNLRIRHRSPTNYGGTDVTVLGTLETEIQIELSSTENPESRAVRTLALADLVNEGAGEELDATGNRLSVIRVPGDQISVEIEREHLVFQPGESFSISVAPNATALIGRTANCRVKLTSAQDSGKSGGFSLVSRSTHSSQLAFQTDEAGSAPPQLAQLVMPQAEGVYNLDLELDASRYASTFGPRKHAIRRRVQVIVLASETTEPERREWSEVYSVDASGERQESSSGWPQFPRITGRGGNEVLGNQQRSLVQLQDRKLLQLKPGGWQAIPLSMGTLGQPHTIEVEYVAAEETTIGMSFLQPDANGQIPTYGFDSGIRVPKSVVSATGDSDELRRHRMTVWPNTKTPYLLIANRHSSSNATLGSIRVLAGPDRLSANGSSGASTVGRRKMMAFYESPLFAEDFGVRRELDPEVAHPLDDWQTFYEGADRLIQYLKNNAYRGAFITVASDGSAIYPSKLLRPSPKHDNGIFFSTGQDPVRKDVLEMLFRMFEREGLLLVPALAMNGTIPEIEALAWNDEANSELQMVDINRHQPSVELSGKLPLYNPLDPRVQTAVNHVVEELTQRYQSHRSFDGVAVVCRADTCTLLPGRQWGYDRETVLQFFQSQPDLGGVPDQWPQVQDILLRSHRSQWIRWRAAKMTGWYRRMAKIVREGLPGGRLYLAPIDLYQNTEAASTLSPSLHSTADFENVLLRHGFEKSLARSSESSAHSTEFENNLVMLNPHRVAPDKSLSSRRVDLAVEGSSQARDYFSGHDYPGDLFTHRVSWAHFAQLQDQSPFGPQQTELMRLQQMALADAFNRERFVKSIKDRDARILVDGGWTINMGQEDSVRDMMQVFTSLPDKRFDDVGSSDHPESNAGPVAVRQCQDQGNTCFYIANASPWETVVNVKLSSESNALPLIRSISNQSLFETRERQPDWSSRDATDSQPSRFGFEFEVAVPAYGLVGGQMAGNCRINDFGFELPQGVDKDLRRHVYALQAKLTRSGNPRPLAVLENSGFEIGGQPSLEGWDAGDQSTGKVSLEKENHAAGVKGPMGLASLQLTNDDAAPVWIRSNVFEASETGRISISVWLKTADPSNQPPLRLALEGQTDRGNYYRFGSVGRLSSDPGSNQVETRWKRFAVHFDDLPVTGIRSLRVGFDLMGPGQVDIDNVQIYDRWFDENDTKAITQMLASTGPLLSEPATFDRCRRLLIGYWPKFLDQFFELEDLSTKGEDASGQQRESSRDGNEESHSGSTAQGARGQEENTLADQPSERRAPMFRRIRNLVPQRTP